MSGRIDETCLFNRALSDLEVELLYVKPLHPTNPSMIHRWSFTGGKTNDSILQANATLAGGALIAGNALVLNGATAHASLPIGNDISLLSNATFEAWVTWSGSQTWTRIFDFGNGIPCLCLSAADILTSYQAGP